MATTKKIISSGSLSQLLFLVVLFLTSLAAAGGKDKGGYKEAIEVTKENYDALIKTADQTKEKLKKAQETYKTIKEYVSGAKGTELIDQLYKSHGIEAQDKITELRGQLQDVLRKLDNSGVEKKLEKANDILGKFSKTAGHAKDALDFMEKFNPEGARGDPTRGLRIIGEAIDTAAKGLPRPMDKIFKEYAKAVTSFSDRLNKLHEAIMKNTRQGCLGGCYSAYADAQDFFEKNFEKKGMASTDFFDVTSEFPKLGKGAQVFKDMINLKSSFYIFSEDDDHGWLVALEFQDVYRYFSALPDPSILPINKRLVVLVSRSNSTDLMAQISEGKRLYAKFSDAYRNKEFLLKSANVWDSISALLLYGEDAFVGFWLLISEKHSEIVKINDILDRLGNLPKATDAKKKAGKSKEDKSKEIESKLEQAEEPTDERKLFLESAEVTPKEGKIGETFHVKIVYGVDGILSDEKLIAKTKLAASGRKSLPFSEKTEEINGGKAKKGVAKATMEADAAFSQSGPYSWNYTIAIPGFKSLQGKVPFLVQKKAEAEPDTKVKKKRIFLDSVNMIPSTGKVGESFEFRLVYAIEGLGATETLDDKFELNITGPDNIPTTPYYGKVERGLIKERLIGRTLKAPSISPVKPGVYTLSYIVNVSGFAPLKGSVKLKVKPGEVVASTPPLPPQQTKETPACNVSGAGSGGVPAICMYCPIVMGTKPIEIVYKDSRGDISNMAVNTVLKYKGLSESDDYNFNVTPHMKGASGTYNWEGIVGSFPYPSTFDITLHVTDKAGNRSNNASCGMMITTSTGG